MVFELNPKCITYRLDGWTIFLFSFWSLFVCIFLSWVNDYKASATFQEHLCSCFKKKVYVWSLISLKLSHCLAISLLLYTCPSTLCTWEMWTDVKETRRISEYWKMSCAFGLHMFNFFFFKKKVAWMKKQKTSVYSICKNGLSVLISCFYPTQTRILCGMGPCSNTQEAVRRSVWSSLSFQSSHSRAAFWVLRTRSNHTLLWISPDAFLLKDQKQFDLGTCPFPVERRCLLPAVFVDTACVFHLKP